MFTSAPLEIQHPEPRTEEALEYLNVQEISMSAAEGNSAITMKQTVQQNGKSLLGTPPNIFDGNRENAKEFMRSFKRWWTLNDDNAAFAIPYKHVALCLSYM